MDGEETGEGDVGGKLVSSEGDRVVAMVQVWCLVYRSQGAASSAHLRK